jgi:hypothetical protein
MIKWRGNRLAAIKPVARLQGKKAVADLVSEMREWPESIPRVRALNGVGLYDGWLTNTLMRVTWLVGAPIHASLG